MDIKKVIQSHGWTLERLAAEMTNKQGERGVTQATVSQIINGNPSLDKLKEIASIIGVSVSELVADGSELTNEISCPHCGKPIKFEKGE